MAIFTKHIRMTNLVKGNLKYTAHLIQETLLFNKVVCSNKIVVSGFSLQDVLQVKDDDGIISDKPICRKDVLEAVKNQHKVFM